MKIVNEKGKLFGIINIVDLLALLLVVFVVAAVAWKIFGDRIAAENKVRQEQANLAANIANRTEVTYTVRCSTQRPEYFDELVKFGFPQQLGINTGVVDGAYVIDAYSEPTVAIAAKDDGSFASNKYGDRVDIVVTIRAEIPKTTFIKVGSQELRVGKSHTIKTQFWEVTGTIESIDCDPQVFRDAGAGNVIIPELVGVG